MKSLAHANLLDSVLQSIVEFAGNVMIIKFWFCIENQLIKGSWFFLRVKVFLVFVIQVADCVLCFHCKMTCYVFCCNFNKRAPAIFSGVILIEDVRWYYLSHYLYKKSYDCVFSTRILVIIAVIFQYRKLCFFIFKGENLWWYFKINF